MSSYLGFGRYFSFDYHPLNGLELVGRSNHLLRLAVGGFLAAIGFGLYRRWVGGNMCTSKASLIGKTAIVTGANTGIGLETAVELARRGARVILACRNKERGKRAAMEVRKRSNNENVVFVQLDLASLSSIRAFANKITREEKHLHILINNAGVALTSYKRTRDGFEMHNGVNHLGPFLLTNLLLDLMKTTSGRSRVVTVSSSLYRRCLEFDFEDMNSNDPCRFNSRSPGRAYSQSKLANILTSRALTRKAKGCGVNTYTVCPGLVRTDLSRDFVNSFPQKMLLWLVTHVLVKSPWQGAQTILHCAISEELEGVSGHLYGNCREKLLATEVAGDDEVADKLWRVSAEMVRLDN